MLLAAQKKTPLTHVLCFDLSEFLQGFEYLLKSSLQLLNTPKEERQANAVRRGGEGRGVKSGD